MLDALKCYLEWQGRMGWEWGRRDCTLFAADWIVFRSDGEFDPGEGLRGTYDNGEEAEAIVAAHGGIDELVGTRLAALGFEAACDAQDGDIGIVSVAGRFLHGGEAVIAAPAIRFGPLWAIRSARGVKVSSFPHGRVWRTA